VTQAGELELRQRESNQINKSLFALSNVISRLAEREQAGSPGRAPSGVPIPYRNSKLTLLLSEALTGNWQTTMVACVSPASADFAVTESTLRFAASAKKLHTRPVRNEEVDGDILRALCDDVESLRRRLNEAKGTQGYQDLHEQLLATQGLVEEHRRSWDEERARSREADLQRRQALVDLGIEAPSPIRQGEERPQTVESRLGLAPDEIQHSPKPDPAALSSGAPPWRTSSTDRAMRMAKNEETLRQLAESAKRVLSQAKLDMASRG
jgi:hypothetical protein